MPSLCEVASCSSKTAKACTVLHMPSGVRCTQANAEGWQKRYRLSNHWERSHRRFRVPRYCKRSVLVELRAPGFCFWKFPSSPRLSCPTLTTSPHHFYYRPTSTSTTLLREFTSQRQESRECRSHLHAASEDEVQRYRRSMIFRQSTRRAVKCGSRSRSTGQVELDSLSPEAYWAS